MPSNTGTRPANEPVWRAARQAGRSVAGIIQSSLVLGTLFLFVILAPLDVRAELSVSQRQTLIRLRGELRNASQQYRRREFKPAASKVQGVQKELGNLLDKVSISDRKQLRTIYKTLERAHALLELEGVEMPALPKLEPRATDKAKPGAGESVSFARDVAPILALQCTGCHGGDRRRNGLSVANFSSLAKGGDSGPIVDRNEPEKSLLITKLRGTGPGQRMPLNRPPLNDATIEKFVEWIRDGAAFDGKNPGQDLTTMSALYRAQHASHSQLSQQRREIALRNWRLAMPDRRPIQTETVDFLVLGTDNENNLQEIANAAQRHSANIRRLLRGTAEGPFINGRMTLFVLAHRYDYVEFGQMVEKRQLPKDWRAHWQYTHLDAYAVTVVSPEEATSDGELAEQLAAVYVASWGDDIPRWFATGVGRVVAARVVPRDTRVRKWDRQSINQRVTASDFTAGRCPPEVAGTIGYRLAKDLMRNSRQFSRLTRELKTDQPFAAAWTATYGVAPEQSVELWLAQRR